ncbi:MAG: type II toxin-antitoxin system PemK/MazF family toxin, partial [Candidatus Nanoarchaeia archaeon]|nr:type II toxin-antitoxin system PemK/MazF family toxin [Candidatus Nanoarchaeia archaeon]
MERFVKGEIVITPFPFSDLSSSVKRPALVVANLKGDNVILCQITTKERQDPYKSDLTINDFESGGLKINSFVMPSILFTIRNSIILYKSGKLKKEKINEIQDKIIG